LHSLRRSVMESAGRPGFGDCGDYSTTVIGGNNLSLF
jgi:hypothetical protein